MSEFDRLRRLFEEAVERKDKEGAKAALTAMYAMVDQMESQSQVDAAEEAAQGLRDIEEHLSGIAYWDEQARLLKAEIAAKHDDLARATDLDNETPVTDPPSE